uniref:Uncharacterized protein n=1 Tax=Moniliophthora roreri TaxID=221103 RepID=A0A0W0EVU1_MONRR
MSSDSTSQTNSPPLMNRLTPECRLVWDNEDLNDKPEELRPVDRSRSPTPRTTEWMEEVYTRLCALCADWGNTAPLTAGSIVARSAPNMHLDIYLVTVTTDEGLKELQSVTIPSAIQLLTTILQTISPGTMRFTETESPERQEPPPRPAFVVDIGEDEGLRYFYRINSPQFQGEWLHMGQLVTSVDA